MLRRGRHSRLSQTVLYPCNSTHSPAESLTPTASSLRDSGILIDAPQDAADWLEAEAAIAFPRCCSRTATSTTSGMPRASSASTAARSATTPTPSRWSPSAISSSSFGFGWEIEPIAPGFHIEEGASLTHRGAWISRSCSCRGIVRAACASWKKARAFFGGDVLFAGGVGRWDLPGGDGPLLFRGSEKVFPLGDDVTVLPGHGPATKIGIERQTNPYVGAS